MEQCDDDGPSDVTPAELPSVLYECTNANPTSITIKRAKTDHQPTLQSQSHETWVFQGQREKISVGKSAGRLRFFRDNWEKLTNDKFVLGCITGYEIKFDQIPYQIKTPRVLINSAKEIGRMKIAVNDLIKKGAIEQCSYDAGQFISPYFLVKKPDGSDRFILNLKGLNEFIAKQHFKMEDFRTAMKLTFPNYFMANLDLKDAYFLIPMCKKHRKYLRFVFKNKIYQFTCLPFGLCVCPLVFTKVMKVVVRYLRQKGLTSVIYLDDMLCIENSKQKCRFNIKITIELLEWLGFIINFEKSKLIPSQNCQFLGFIIDSKKFLVRLPEEKKLKILKLIRDITKKKEVKIVQLAQLVGKMVSYTPAVEYAWVYIKNLEKALIESLYNNSWDYDAIMELPKDTFSDLKWWRQNIKTATNRIKTNKFEVKIYTDASKSGWGATDGKKQIFGFWDENQSSYHINYLELLTVQLALK